MFSIKLYEKNGTTLKKVINVNLMTKFKGANAEINGGYGNINLSFALPVTNEDFEGGNIIEVQFKQDIIYRGSILTAKKIYSPSQEVIELTLVGYASLLTRLLTSESYIDNGATVVRALIDDFNTEYGSNLLSYDVSSIPDSIGDINIEFDDTDYLKAIKTVADTVGLFFFIDLDGKVFLKAKGAFESHTLRAGKDVQNLQIAEDIREMVNSLTLSYSGGIEVYEDIPSQTLYGKKEESLDESSSIKNLATADSFGEAYIEKFKDKIKKVSIIVNNEYNFFTIKPGDSISVRNIGYTINDLQVAKISYGLEQASIELERSYSFSGEIFNNQN